MDISTLVSKERVIEIKHPATEQDLGIRVTIMSINDDRMKSIRRRCINRRLELEKRGKSLKADDLEDNEIELIIGAVTGWDWYGDIDFNGAKPEFNENNLRKVLSTFPWFKQQIDDAITDEKAFF